MSDATLPKLGLTPNDGAQLPSDVLSRLPQAERERALQFMAQIDPGDDAAMRLYGAAEQGALATFVDMAMPVLMADAATGALAAVSQLTAQLGRWDNLCRVGGLQGIVWRLLPAMMLWRLRQSFGAVSPAIERAGDALLDARIGLMRTLVVLERMERENDARFDRLSAYVACGKLLKKRKADELDNYAVGRLERRIHDLELSRQVSLQMAAQLALIKNSCRQTADQMQVTLNTTIPLWKAGAMLTLGMAQQDVTDEAHRRAADALGRSLTAESKGLSKRGKWQKQGQIQAANAKLKAGVEALAAALDAQRGLQTQIHQPS